MRLSKVGALIVVLLITYPMLAQPAEEPEQPAYDELVRRLEEVEAELASQRANNQLAAPAIGPYFEPEACPIEPAPAATYPTVKINGVFQLDALYFDQDVSSKETLGDIDDALGFRRSRLAASGNVTQDTSYLMEYDFAQSQARFVDVWMQFADTPLGTLRIGRYRQPFGMAELTSVKELPFLERPVTFALAPFRQTGAMLSDTALDERATWAVSGYRYLSDNFGNVYADSGGYGMATRLTAIPLASDDDHLMHVGFDYSFNDPGRDAVQFTSTDEVSLGQNPNLGLAGLSVLPIVGVPAFVNTGPIPTQNTNLLNFEAAAKLGSLVVQSEVRWAMLEQLSGANDTFEGAYLHVRYVLTGETIPYNRTLGVFGQLTPVHPVDWRCGNWGAWEIAARVSYVDLNGTALPGPGRRLTDSTIGLNWYVNRFTKFQAYYIHSDLNDPSLGTSDTNTFAFRGQLVF